MRERHLVLPGTASEITTPTGRDFSDVLAYPPGNFPHSDHIASSWERKWDIWRATTLDLYPEDINQDNLSGQNVEEAFVLPDNEIGRREC